MAKSNSVAAGLSETIRCAGRTTRAVSPASSATGTPADARTVGRQAASSAMTPAAASRAFRPLISSAPGPAGERGREPRLQLGTLRLVAGPFGRVGVPFPAGIPRIELGEPLDQRVGIHGACRVGARGPRAAEEMERGQDQADAQPSHEGGQQPTWRGERPTERDPHGGACRDGPHPPAVGPPLNDLRIRRYTRTT